MLKRFHYREMYVDFYFKVNFMVKSSKNAIPFPRSASDSTVSKINDTSS